MLSDTIPRSIFSLNDIPDYFCFCFCFNANQLFVSSILLTLVQFIHLWIVRRMGCCRVLASDYFPYFACCALANFLFSMFGKKWKRKYAIHSSLWFAFLPVFMNHDIHCEVCVPLFFYSHATFSLALFSYTFVIFVLFFFSTLCLSFSTASILVICDANQILFSTRQIISGENSNET